MKKKMYNSDETPKKRSEDAKDSIVGINKIKSSVLPALISFDEIICVESQENNIRRLLDMEAGIDYFLIDKHGMRSIATRVQYDYTCNTFTIRTERESGGKTELEKRLFAIKNGYLYPEYTLQAYFDNKVDLNLYSIAIIKTTDLFNYYKTNPDDFVTHGSNGAVFKAVHWNYLKNLRINIYKADDKDNYPETPL